MENLDNDVLENILFRLPIGAASQAAKRVCKSWKTILDDRRHNEVGFLFACGDLFGGYSSGLHVNKTRLYFGEEYDHVDGNKMNYYYSHETLMGMENCRFTWRSSNDEDFMVGSCNGLVCLQKGDGINTPAEPFAICNPVTGEFIFLKENSSREWNKPKQVATGFGYFQTTKEYKVVRLYTLDGCSSHVQVYTLGSNEWRDIETVIDYSFGASAVFANGVLHWLEDVVGNIFAFDLEDEKFRLLPRPPSEVLELQPCGNELKFLGGNLCWVQTTRKCIDMWAYKRNKRNTSDTRYRTEEYNHKRDYYSEKSWNWVKEYTVDTLGYGYIMPFAITKRNQVLLLGTKNFYCYDSKTRVISKLGDDNGGMGCSNIEAIPHANSYVSLKDYGETWYGPGCLAVPKTNSYVSLEEVRDAYYSRKRKRQS